MYRIEIDDEVEISRCYIKNDVGGTTNIRNVNFESETKGSKITLKNLNGEEKTYVLEDNDKLVNEPICVKVIDQFYDYETGYNYIGKVCNKKLLKSLNKCGRTGYKPDDYKKYENKSLYDEALKASENYDSSLVYFSEFDIIKKLDVDKIAEMEI